ncbi:MAG: Gfo/Idh/MocA family oxidoreductase [Sedimentisphaerales bacterium]|nr:Gfo/Idh/MocA family oxidoreductase [Sedimentisphaerales bacterium]
MTKLRTAIAGIGGYGQLVLNAIVKNDLLQLTAIADQNREKAANLAQQYEAAAYDDYRSLIVQEELDVLFLALPTFLCGDCIKAAAKRNMHIFKEAPLARTLPEAAQWAKLLKQNNLRFHVSAPKRFSPPYLEAHRLIAQQHIGNIYLVRAESFCDYQDHLNWRSDPILAGGGVLLEQAYHLIDQIIWNLGNPAAIFSLNTAQAGQHLLPPARTEDAVTLTMKFPNDCAASINAAWLTTPEHESLTFHGTQGTIQIQPDRLRIYDSAGKLTNDEQYDIDEQWLIDQQVRHFADSLIDPEIIPVAPAAEHLANVSVIESAYLSNRTQMPEPFTIYGSLFDIQE